MPDNQLSSTEVFVALEQVVYRAMRRAIQESPATGKLLPRKEPGDSECPSLLVSAPEAAKLLAISERTLFDLTKNVPIPVARVGAAKRYRVKDLEAYVDSLVEDQLQPPREDG